MIDQEEIHKQCLSSDPKERIHGLEELSSFFSLIPDKQQACNDLHTLTNDKYDYVRSIAAKTLGYVFSQVSDKQQAWNDLHRLTDDQDHWVKDKAISALFSAFSHVPDKEQAWEDLIRLTSDQEEYVRCRAANALSFAFPYVPDKQKAWEDLIRLISDKKKYIRYGAADALGFAFPQVQDKKKNWEDLIRLTCNKEKYVRRMAAGTLVSAFSRAPDKQKAYENLVRTSDKNGFVKYWVIDTFVSAFSYVPDKQKVWEDLIRLTSDKEGDVRHEAASALVSAFSHVPDKQKAWNDLIRLTSDQYMDVRSGAADALSFAFSYVSDKQKAWEDLIRLTSDQEEYVRCRAANALSFAFPYVPDKQKAWYDLHILTSDQQWNIRYWAASILGSVYSHVPDKQQVQEDLIRLTSDQDYDVRIYANYSLAKTTIFKASQARTEEDYKYELEKAIKFFEKAAQESVHAQSYFDPSKFCLPFYRSFYTIVFKKQDAKEEVEKCLIDAKNAIKGSKSKELLLEVVDNLANALKEVQNLDILDLEIKKSELDFYRKYCDRAAELMRMTEEEAPYATAAMRKGLPILDRNLKGLIEEIQNKAKITCHESQGTPTQEIACDVYREVQNWGIGNQEEMTLNVSKVVMVLKSKIPHTLENKEILDMIESMKYEKDLTKQYSILPVIIGLIPTVNVVPADPVIEKMENSQREILEAITKIGGRLDYISAGMNPGISEELILHLGYITSAGGVEYTLTIPLKGLSYLEIKEELKEIASKRISQLSMLPKKTAKIVEDYLVKNKMEDLLQKLH